MLLEMPVHPLAEYVLLAAGLVLCTFLFITLKQDIQRIHKRYSERQQLLQHSIRELTAEIDAVKSVLKKVEEKAGALPQLHPPKPGMNVSRRTQVLRMYRRGERPEQIAAALSLAQNEVDLLLKVHQAVHPA